ncbi:MAG: DUF5678 domain-containing protein [bacterium]|nr:DUF5678 domain-containing protein [bacterium]
MNSDKSRIKDLLDKRLSIPSSPPQLIFIVNQTFINNFPAPKNPYLKEESQSISSEIDPTFFEEERAFLQMKDLLYEEYPEKYVAIKDGKVIDSDEDNSGLAERVYKGFKPPIFIDKVTREEEVAYLVSPKTDV